MSVFGDLNVAGITTLGEKLTVSSGGAAITGVTTILQESNKIVVNSNGVGINTEPSSGSKALNVNGSASISDELIVQGNASIGNSYEDSHAIKGKVQIMTLHKSKGDEFEYVFIPELSEKALSIDVTKMNLKASTIFMEQIRGFNPKYKIKSEVELKEFSAEESMRLFYVAVTRAKKKLYITSSQKTKSFNREIEQEPSIVFEELLNF